MQALNVVKIVVLTTAVAVIAGCGGLPDKTDETATWSTNKLYSEAKDSLDSSDWTKCAQYFEALEGRDPFGPYAQQAQLNVPYCQWRDNDTDQANKSIDRFIRLHPDHPDIDYAYYLQGLINFNDDLGLLGRYTGQNPADRDPKALTDSYQSFKTVVDRFPKSKYAADAAQRMRYIVNALATHEVHVADYYYRRGAYVAAINRAQNALKNYQGTPASEDALHVMIESYRALNRPQLADDTQRILASTFPDSPYLPGNAGRLRTNKKPWYQIW